MYIPRKNRGAPMVRKPLQPKAKKAKTVKIGKPAVTKKTTGPKIKTGKRGRPAAAGKR